VHVKQRFCRALSSAQNDPALPLHLHQFPSSKLLNVTPQSFKTRWEIAYRKPDSYRLFSLPRTFPFGWL